MHNSRMLAATAALVSVEDKRHAAQADTDFLKLLYKPKVALHASTA